ncbi:MAG TPA: hypothetical protein DEP53_04210 [Bacteroidetes bacterium]|nr:hypothetical protein [Bacteroidota bacterium]
MTFNARFLWLVAGCLAVGEISGTVLHARQTDGVPRKRLMSDVELLAQLSGVQRPEGDVSDVVKKGDSASARRRLADYFSSRKTPRFFFSKDEVKERAREYARLFPKDIVDAQKRAGDFVKAYGADVDWMMPGKDLRGRAHTPNTVRYLARQWEAVNLAIQFYRENENPQILRFLMTQVRDFAADFEAGKVETGDNDVFERFYGGHRIRNWIMMHHLLLASPLYTADDQVLMLKLVLLHGAKLADQSKSFHWGNHQLVGLVALYELSTLFPEFRSAVPWHAQSRKLILEHLEKEIAPDGFQAERSSHYHKLDIANYFLVLQLARLNGETLPPVFHERFRRMFQAMADVAMPNKCMPILQDVSDSLDVRSDRIDDEMSLGALLFENRTFRYFGKNEFPASLYWYFDRNAASRYRSLRPEPPSFTSFALAQTGYYVMRTGWGASDSYLLIDGGLAADKPDHTHGGVLGVIGYALGEVVLPNYPVRYSDISFKVMKNSLAKNVAIVDNVLQGKNWIDNKARTGFGKWGSLPKPAVQYWVSGSEFDYFGASHNGFRDAGVDYSRSVLFLKPDAWLVIDYFKSGSMHSYGQLWQGDYRIDTGKKRAVRESQRGFVELIAAGVQDIEIQEHHAAHASGVRVQKRTNGPDEIATLIYVGKGSQPGRATAAVANSDGLSKYTVHAGAYTWIVELMRKDDAKPSEGGPLLEVSKFKGKVPDAVFVVDGTRLKAGDLDVELSKPASWQLVKGKKNKWVFTLLTGEMNVLTAGSEGKPVRRYDVKPGQPLLLPNQ